MTALTHNPRVIDACLAPTAEAEMRAAGVTDYGIRVMAPKARHFAVLLENVPRLHANLIKQHILSIGGEAAVHKHIPTEKVQATSLLLTATLAQLDALRRKLDAQPFGLPEVGQLIVRTVADYRRRHWALPCGTRTLDAGPAPTVMGVVNVTPDSFSDGGRFLDPAAAVDHGLQLARSGAAILDVGGESTRPGADEVSADEEMRRVLPVIAGLKKQSDALVSIDTRKPPVARAALDAGADIVNDVSALADPDMAPLVAAANCPVILMHMQGTPATMQLDPRYDDVVADVCRSLRQALARAAQAGIDLERTIIDPGIGFGKTFQHNLTLLRRFAELRSLGRPILVGTSRKAFLGRILDADVGNRLMGTVATCVWTRALGAAIFRVHDVAEVVLALKVVAAVETVEDRP